MLNGRWGGGCLPVVYCSQNSVTANRTRELLLLSNKSSFSDNHMLTLCSLISFQGCVHTNYTNYDIYILKEPCSVTCCVLCLCVTHCAIAERGHTGVMSSLAGSLWRGKRWDRNSRIGQLYGDAAPPTGHLCNHKQEGQEESHSWRFNL